MKTETLLTIASNHVDVTARNAGRERRAGSCFAVSTLTLALLAAFPSMQVHAEPMVPNPIAVDGTDAPVDISNGALTNNTGGDSTPGRTVSATAGGKVTLTDSTVSQTYTGSKTWGLYANGEGSSISATRTDITVDGTGMTGGNAPVGVDAGNGATVTLKDGSITMTGDNRTIAVRTTAGGTTHIDGTAISTRGDNSHAVFSFESVGAPSPIAQTNIANATVTTSGQNSYALYAQNTGSEVHAINVDVTTTGNVGRGVHAFGGGVVTVNGGSVETSGNNAEGMLASEVDPEGNVASIISTGATVTTHGTGSAGVAAGLPDEERGNVEFTGGSITTTGKNSAGALAQNGGTISLHDTLVSVEYAGAAQYGIYATGEGSTITADGTTIRVTSAGASGEQTIGTRAEKGGAISLTGGSVEMTGADRTIAVYSGTGGTTTTTNTAISTTGRNSHAVEAYMNAGAGASADPALVTVNGGTIRTAGENSYGVIADNTGAGITVNDAAITTTGNVGRGVYAWSGGTVDVHGGTIETSGDFAEGMMAAAADTNGNAGTVTATGTTIITHGNQSAGVSAGGSDGSSGVVNFSSGQIATMGDKSAGAAAQFGGTINLHETNITASGNDAAAVSVSAGGIVNVDGGTLTSAKSAGISLTDNATVVLDRTTVRSAGASIASTLAGAGQTQNITIGENSNLTQNNGTLLQVDRTTDGMDGIVNLTLQAGSVSRGDIVDIDGLTEEGVRLEGGKTNFTMEDGASWMGTIEGLHDASIGDGGVFVDNGGKPIAGDVTSGSNAQVVFTNGADIAGNVTSGENSTVSFSGPTTIGADVVGDGAAFRFSTNGPTTIAGDIVLDNGASTHGGTVTVPINVAGDVVVNNATFGGNMNVQGTLSGTNGTLAPGNSIGTQTFGSMAGFSGTYHAEVNAAGMSDKIIIQSNADLSTIGLTVGQENGNGGYRLGTAYTILETTNGGVVQNQFASAGVDASLANSLVKLDPVQYDPTDVKITLSLDQQKVAAARTGLTRNQNAVLSSAISVAGANAAADALFTAANGREDALNQLSGNGYASTKAAMIEDSHYVRDAALGRVRDVFAEAPQPDNQVTAYGGNVWTKAFGAWRNKDGMEDAAGFSSSTGGLLIGTDAVIANDWRVGVMGGYSHTDFDARSRVFSGSSDNYHAGIYGGTQEGSLAFRVGAAYSWHDIDTSRTLGFAGYADRTGSHYDAGTAQAFGELAYQFQVAQIGLEPFANLAYVSLHTDGFTERGGDAALQVQSDDVDTAFSTLGLRASSRFTAGSTDLTARGTLGWQHAYGEVNPRSAAAFAGGQAFSVSGVPVARDVAVVEIGLSAKAGKDSEFGLSYSGQLGAQTEDHDFSVNFIHRF